MKKTYHLVFVGFAMLFCSSVNAYWITLHNKTDGKVKYHIKEASCSDDKGTLNPGQKKKVRTHAKTDLVGTGCCIKSLSAKKVSGTGTVGVDEKNLPRAKYNPPLTGYGISCKGFKVVIQDAGPWIVMTRPRYQLNP